MIEAYPLSWPAGYPRSRFPQRAIFKTAFAKTRDQLTHELSLLGATQVVISSNIPLRRDGLPYAGQAQPKDPGIAVYFLWQKEQRVLACDKWDRVEDNLHAIELAVGAIRGLERWGVSDILKRAFQGFTALPGPSAKPPWWHVLDCERSAPLETVERVYRTYAKECHPDRNGQGEWNGLTMTDLNRAIQEARQEKNDARS